MSKVKSLARTGEDVATTVRDSVGTAVSTVRDTARDAGRSTAEQAARAADEVRGQVAEQVDQVDQTRRQARKAADRARKRAAAQARQARRQVRNQARAIGRAAYQQAVEQAEQARGQAREVGREARKQARRQLRKAGKQARRQLASAPVPTTASELRGMQREVSGAVGQNVYRARRGLAARIDPGPPRRRWPWLLAVLAAGGVAGVAWSLSQRPREVPAQRPQDRSPVPRLGTVPSDGPTGAAAPKANGVAGDRRSTGGSATN